MLNAIMFFLVVVLYHETAHAIAANQYDCLDAFVLYKAKSGLKQLVVWGPAVQIEDEFITDRQELTVLLAPLLLIPVGGLVGILWHFTQSQTAYLGAIIFGTAGLMTLVSDLPAVYFDLTNEERLDIFTLWTFRSDAE